jgi:hypothetical protein
MPAHEKDPKGVKKKRHIGNDFVAIAYNNSGGRYERNTVKCQFMYACVVIVPLDHGSNKVHIECKPELNEPLGHIRVRVTCTFFATARLGVDYTCVLDVRFGYAFLRLQQRNEFSTLKKTSKTHRQ